MGPEGAHELGFYSVAEGAVRRFGEAVRRLLPTLLGPE